MMCDFNTRLELHDHQVVDKDDAEYHSITSVNVLSILYYRYNVCNVAQYKWVR